MVLDPIPNGRHMYVHAELQWTVDLRVMSLTLHLLH